MSMQKVPRSPDAVRTLVREGYTDIAERRAAHGEMADRRAVETSRKIGYSEADLAAIPDDANLGVGCGNPTAMDTLKPGEVVVDLGSGAGMDAFLAARQVGAEGRVIGVDMTDAMLEKARANATGGDFTNVEFRKGTIERLPIDDDSVDVVLSNCVINLSPEKPRVFAEAYRVLRRGGRLMVSDVVIERPLPDGLADAADAYFGCVGGASLKSEYLEMIERAGFDEVTVKGESNFGATISVEEPYVRDTIAGLGLSAEQAADALASLTSLQVFARKP